MCVFSRHAVRRAVRVALLGFVLATTLAAGILAMPAEAGIPAMQSVEAPSPLFPAQQSTLTRRVFLPLIRTGQAGCQEVPNQTYVALSVNPPPTDRPAEFHADLNLGWRGYTPTTGLLGLVDIGGPVDVGAPQFPGLFTDNRTPVFTSGYKVYNWSWACNCRTTPILNPAITLLGAGTAAEEVIRVPPSGYTIGSGFEVLVLYADQTRVTLKYTREDNVIAGYTIHLERVCPDPRLLQLYRNWNAAGRAQLPALAAGQGFGRATGPEILLSIQDSGAWMDPRSRKDWWQGR